MRAAASDGGSVTPLADTLAACDRAAIIAFTDAIHYVLPKLLLTATALDLQATGDFAVNGMPQDGRDPLIPFGVAAGAGRLSLVDPADAGPSVQALFADIHACHGHPGVASYYRGLGQYPKFLAAAWQAVRRHVGSESYRCLRWLKPQPARNWSTGYYGRNHPRPTRYARYWQYFATV